MMATTELLDVQPHELTFTCSSSNSQNIELKKQSTCSIQLANKSDQYVAFKVKTTSPKKYSVRPNAGIIQPKATCDFTVTMQAQRVAPPDLQCKDKFLIQSTVIPFGTTEEDITSGMFSKDSGKYVEEKKLRVVLTSPPPSPVLLPSNGESKQDPCYETSVQKDRVLSGVENIPPPHKVSEDVEGFETYKDMDESRAVKDVEELKPAKDAVVLNLRKDIDESRAVNDAEELKPAKDVVVMNLAKDFEELKTKLNAVESKLKEADLTIMKLTEEKSMTTREKNMLKHELELLRRKNNVRKVMVGFPLLYVCMVSLIGLALGYYIHR